MIEEKYLFKIWCESPFVASDIKNENIRKAFEIIEEEYQKTRKERKEKAPLQKNELDQISKIVRDVYDEFIKNIIRLDYNNDVLEKKFKNNFVRSGCCEGCRFLSTFESRSVYERYFCLSSFHCIRSHTVDAYLIKHKLFEVFDDMYDLYFEHFVYNKISVESFYNLLDYTKLSTYDKGRRLGRDIQNILNRQILEDITNFYGKRIIRFITNYKKKYERAFSNTIETESPEGQD